MINVLNIKKVEQKINSLEKKGNIQKAIEVCQAYLIDNPTIAKMHIRLGDLYMAWHLDINQVKQYIDEAITEYQIALEDCVDNGDIYYKIGFALYHKGDLDKAMNYFTLAINNGASKSQCHYMLANCYKKKDRYADALKETSNALKYAFLNTSRIRYLRHRLLNVVFFADKRTKFESHLNLILSFLTLPFDKEAQRDFFSKCSVIKIIPELFSAMLYYKAQDYENVLNVYKQAIEKMSGYPPLYCLLGDVLRALGKHEDAIPEYNMALLIDPMCLSAYQGLTQTYEEMGDYDSAINTYLKFIALHPNNAVLHAQLANLYFMKGDIKEAVSHYQTAITLNPKKEYTSLAAITLGYTQQTVTKNVEAAISSFQIGAVLQPKDIEVYIRLGSAFYDMQDYENALIVYRRALELEPENAQIHCNLGYLYWGMENITEAIAEYNLSIKYDPDYAITHNNLGVIYLDDLVHINQAKECFERAIEKDPNYALAHYNLARTLAVKGEKIEAAKYYQMALDINSITEEIDPEEIQDRLNNLFD